MIRRASVRAAVACSAATLLSMTACSLIVSTSGLSGADAPGVDGGDAALTEAGEDAQKAPDAHAAVDGGDAAADPSLLAQLSFEDPDGLIASDSSGHGKVGALKGGATFAAGGIDGGRALQLHGPDYVEVEGLRDVGFPRSGTLSIWFRYTFASDDPADRGVFDDWDNTRSHVFMRRPPSAPLGEFQIALQPVGAGAYAVAASFTPMRDTWTHLVATWDSDNGIGALYAEGVLLVQKQYERPFVPTTQHFRLGNGMIGFIDEVRLYNRPLTPPEIGALD